MEASQSVMSRLDLNLLKVFDAIFEDRNLVLAGRRLNLSQSAVSHALGRLRDLLGDELFLRTGKGMVPTARASAMAPTVRDCLRRIDATLAVERFVPGSSRRRFVIAANDHVTAVILGPLSRKLQELAPGVDLVVRPSTRLDLAEQIDLGRIDLAIGIFSQVPDRLQTCRLMTEGEAIVMRKGHPASGSDFDLQALARYPLLTISVGGQEEGAVDGFILERGLARQSEMFDRNSLEEALKAANEEPRMRVVVPHSLAIPALLERTDMLSIVPASLAAVLTRGGALIARTPPYPAGSFTLRAVWHSRDEHEEGHVWLRERVCNIAADEVEPSA